MLHRAYIQEPIDHGVRTLWVGPDSIETGVPQNRRHPHCRGRVIIAEVRSSMDERIKVVDSLVIVQTKSARHAEVISRGALIADYPRPHANTIDSNHEDGRSNPPFQRNLHYRRTYNHYDDQGLVERVGQRRECE